MSTNDELRPETKAIVMEMAQSIFDNPSEGQLPLLKELVYDGLVFSTLVSANTQDKLAELVSDRLGVTMLGVVGYMYHNKMLDRGQVIDLFTKVHVQVTKEMTDLRVKQQQLMSVRGIFADIMQKLQK